MLLKASNFREIKGMPYTMKEYIGGIPGSKIVRFTLGNIKEDFEYVVRLLNLKEAQMRHSALEAARVAVNRVLEADLGGESYKLMIVPYPPGAEGAQACAEVTRNRFMNDLNYKDVQIGTEELQSEAGRPRNVSAITIVLKKGGTDK